MHNGRANILDDRLIILNLLALVEKLGTYRLLFKTGATFTLINTPSRVDTLLSHNLIIIGTPQRYRLTFLLIFTVRICAKWGVRKYQSSVHIFFQRDNHWTLMNPNGSLESPQRASPIINIFSRLTKK